MDTTTALQLFSMAAPSAAGAPVVMTSSMTQLALPAPPMPMAAAAAPAPPQDMGGSSSASDDPNCQDGAASDLLHQERMEYIRQLVQEKEALGSTNGCDVARRLIEQELERVQSGRKSDEKRTVEVTKEKSIKVTVKVLVPVREHPKFNFVGKLLGPKGNSLKRLQEETMTKMAILGRGSFRDKAKEEELRKNPDPKYSHLHEELHVEVTAHAPPAEAYARIAYALTEIRRYLVPDHNDEIRQEQMREMQILSGRPAVLAIEGGADATTETSGTLSPPNSLSPPPTAPVKLPTSQQMAVSHATGQPTIAPTLITHPALRGISQFSAMPNMAANPAMAGAMLGRFPTLLPIGSMPTLTAAATAPRSIPMYEEYTDLSTAIQQPAEYDQLFLNGHEDKKDVMKVSGGANRGRFRHDPYKRITINVPS